MSVTTTEIFSLDACPCCQARGVCCGCTAGGTGDLCCEDPGPVPTTLHISLSTNCGGPYSGTLTWSKGPARSPWTGTVDLVCEQTDFLTDPPTVTCQNVTVAFILYCGDCIATEWTLLVICNDTGTPLGASLISTSCTPFELVFTVGRPIEAGCQMCGFDFGGSIIRITE